jgi:2-isopropylmalate synthase
MIRETVKHLKSKKRDVIFDAEHFFDGYRANPDYARQVLAAAADGGCDWIVLCDTNGGSLPEEVQRVTLEMHCGFSVPFGIHAHNDSELAVANTLAAVQSGATMVQGTINGYGERCGNANLCTVIPNLQLKAGCHCLEPAQLRKLTHVSRSVAEIANLAPREYSPYVGLQAFAHKGGLHVDAVRKTPLSYEHVPPAVVGNERRIIISEQAGVASVLFKAEQMGIKLAPGSDEAKNIIEKIKLLEHAGYKFEGADGSFRLLVEKHRNRRRKFFTLMGFRVIVEQRDDKLISEATIKLKVRDQIRHTAAEGDGPVNALDNALRQALKPFYPGLRKMQLVDFKVRVLDSKAGTESKVRVFIESRDEKTSWGTIGVSTNIIEASWEALLDAFEFKLHADTRWR